MWPFTLIRRRREQKILELLKTHGEMSGPDIFYYVGFPITPIVERLIKSGRIIERRESGCPFLKLA